MYWLIWINILTISINGFSSESSNTNEDDLSGLLVAFDTTMENYTVPISSKCVLTCYIAEVRTFKVLWQKIERTNINSNTSEQLTLIAFDGIVYSNKDHYRLESDYVGSYNLIIDRVNEDDQGEYQCQINTEPRKTKRIFLTVQVPPRITNFSPNPPLFSIRNGSLLRLLCQAEGIPTPTIRWRIRDQQQNELDTPPPENSSIWFIPSISTNFPRTIECIADNGVLPASNRIFTINVEFPPTIIIPNDLIQAHYSENLTLECQVLSRPSSRLIWEKNGRILSENSLHTIEINRTMSIHRLHIQMNSDDDFGQYNCLAENIHGKMDAIIFVLKESITTRKYPHYSKSSKQITKSIRLTTITNDIRMLQITSSSSNFLINNNYLTYVLFLRIIFSQFR